MAEKEQALDLLNRLLTYKSDGVENTTFWTDETQYFLSDHIEMLCSERHDRHSRFADMKTRRRLLADILFRMTGKNNYLMWVDGCLKRVLTKTTNSIVHDTHRVYKNSLTRMISKLHVEGLLPEPEPTPESEPTLKSEPKRRPDHICTPNCTTAAVKPCEPVTGFHRKPCILCKKNFLTNCEIRTICLDCKN